MKWSMDTHKYISEVTRTALKILADDKITSMSSPDEIKEAEQKLAQAAVYRDYESAKGRTRRALFTYFKSYGCMDSNEKLTEMGQLFAYNKISIKEFSFWYIVNYLYQEGENVYYPTELVIKALQLLQDKNEAEAYISPYDFSRIVDCNKKEEVNDELIDELISVRKSGVPEVNERTIGYDVWAKMFVQSGILKRDEKRCLRMSDRLLADWIMQAYNKPMNEQNGLIENGIIKYIPMLDIHQIKGDAQAYSEEGAALSVFLFESLSDDVIRKYILKDNSVDIESLLAAFGISADEKGFYSNFVGYEHLIGYLLQKNENAVLSAIGNMLLDIPVLETFENYVQPYQEPIYKTLIDIDFERNRIVFGAPGTGKSNRLKDDSNDFIEKWDGTMERVTFHPDYSYAQFVGTYKPVTDSNGDIRYDFVPGPFMRVYVEAIKSGRTEAKPHILLIEEINRAKVAAVFGDVFQLLDRDDDGVSEYEIQTSEDIRKYLASELGGTPDNWKKIKLPNNMFIWATMNSADQGVFPMDTAFKRRWSFEYLGINQNQEKITGMIVLGGDEEPVVWNKLRKAINDKLAKDYKVNEDKLMGPFFLSKKVIKTDEAGMIADTKKFIDTFKSKVIMYLYEDAAKQHKHKLFSGCDSSKYSSVCDAFEEIGMGIFGEDFKANYYDQQEG